MKAASQFAAAVVAAALGASIPAHAGEGPAQVPPVIAVPGGYEVKVKLSATGVQIYKCQPSATVATDFVWTFVAPEASLFSEGKPAGRHYAGPTWEANDGSKVVGKLVAKVAAPDGVSISWLLLSATVVQAGETFGKVAFVQRLHTSGGAAPSTGCTSENASTEVRVPYTADYFFYSLDH
jgi:hypothetical protein